MAYINFFKMYKPEAFDTVRLCNPSLRLLCVAMGLAWSSFLPHHRKEFKEET